MATDTMSTPSSYQPAPSYPSHTQSNQTQLTYSNSPPSFIFPRPYQFPPFFTPQPNTQTNHARLQKWSSLIQAYCQHHKIFRLSLSKALDTDLFYNARIGKRIDGVDARGILEYMKGEARGEWIVDGNGRGGDKEKGDEFWVYWRTVEEWATLVSGWVEETAQKGMVLTLYELVEGEGTVGQDFHGMDMDLLQRALQVLVKRGKAQVFGEADQLGVKFF